MNNSNIKHSPLTYPQEGIWYATQASQTSKLYATGQALYLRGDIDFNKLPCAIEAALSECEVLRHHFSAVDGKPSFSLLSSNQKVEICNLSLHDRPADIASEQMQRLIHQEIGQDNLYQHEHRLYVINENEAIWFSRIHHIAFDAYAYHLLHQRAGQHYNALICNETVPPCNFVDVSQLAEDDHNYKYSSQYSEDHDYWLERCKQMPSPSFIGGAVEKLTFESICAEEIFSKELSSLLMSFYENNHRISLADMLLAAFASYFSSCIGGEQNLLFGLPCMGRRDNYGSNAAITRSNILPLILELPDNATFYDVCNVVAKSKRQLSRHERYRGEWIGRAIGKIGDSLPLYGIELNILPQLTSLDFTGLKVSAKHISTGPVRDINVHLELSEDMTPSSLRLIANSSRHNLHELKLHISRIFHWLRQLVLTPKVPIHDLQLAMPDDFMSISRWNETDHALSSESIIELFEQQVETIPHQPAVVDDTGELTYSELDLHSRRFAMVLDHQLRGARGKVIGVALKRSIELEIVLLAIIRVGAVILPLSFELPVLRLQKMLEQAGACLTITDQTERNRVPQGHTALDFESLSLLAKRCVDPSLQNFGKLSGSEPAYILFTSGSSGEPKGVMVNHLALANRIQWMQNEYDLQRTDRVLQKTPATFDVSIWEFFWPLTSGATLVMAKPGGHTDPTYLLNCIEHYKITTLHFVPSMLALFLDALERHPISLPLLRVFASGEALSAELVQRYNKLLNTPLHNLYGPTEAAIDVTFHAVTNSHTNCNVPIGRPIWNTKIHILDPFGKTTPIGIPGELYIEGICLATGYVGQPNLTAERFTVDKHGRRLYRTGDLACWNINGEINYFGRLDQQVKINGQRVELEEIDAVILKYPQINHACTNMYDGRIIAYIVSSSGEVDINLLLSFCRKFLPTHMIPQYVLEILELPLNSNGKLNRKELPKPPVIKSKGTGVPSSLIEQRLCEYFSDVLELSKVSPDENFFDLGGNSLNAVDVAARINSGLGWEITIANIFSHPTPKSLAEHGQIHNLNMLDTTLLLRPNPANSETCVPTLFCIHPAGGIAWCYSGLARFIRTPCEIVGLQAQGLTSENNPIHSMEEIAETYVNRICERQPHGPYWLIGWSVGGMIAHSVAARLEKRGKKVSLLAMMDSYPSDLWRRFAFEELNPQEEESMALAALLFIAGIALPFDGELPSLMVPKGKVLERSQAIDLLRRNGNALASLNNITLDRLIDVVILSRRLVGRTNHDVFNGDILFFTAAAPRAEYWLHSEAWSPYVRGRIQNINIDCDHPGMARTEALREISSYLDEAFFDLLIKN